VFIEAGSLYVDQVGLKLRIHLPQLPQCWDNRRCTTTPDMMFEEKTKTQFFLSGK
jgi:hypothetical protein